MRLGRGGGVPLKAGGSREAGTTPPTQTSLLLWRSSALQGLGAGSRDVVRTTPLFFARKSSTPLLFFRAGLGRPPRLTWSAVPC